MKDGTALVKFDIRQIHDAADRAQVVRRFRALQNAFSKALLTRDGPSALDSRGSGTAGEFGIDPVVDIERASQLTALIEYAQRRLMIQADPDDGDRRAIVRLDRLAVVARKALKLPADIYEVPT